MPRIAANSSVTQRMPAARSPSTLLRFKAKWKTTNVVTAHSAMPGTDSSVRSSTSSSLRSSARTTASVRARGRDAPARRARPTGGCAPGWAGAPPGPGLWGPADAPAAPSERDVGLGEAAAGIVAADDSRAARARADQRLDELDGGRIEVRARGRAAAAGRGRAGGGRGQ